MTSSLQVRHPVRGWLRFGVRLPLWLCRAQLGWLLGERFLRLTHMRAKNADAWQRRCLSSRFDPVDSHYLVPLPFSENRTRRGKRTGWRAQSLEAVRVLDRTRQ